MTSEMIGADMLILSVVFGAESIQVSFLERRLQSDRGGIESTLFIASDDYADLINDIQDALTEVVDDYIVELRNPPEVLPAAGSGRDRLRSRKEAPEEGPALEAERE